MTEKIVSQERPVQEKPLTVTRKVFKTGHSLCLTLPPEWCRRFNVTEGSYLHVLGGKNLTVLAPWE